MFDFGFWELALILVLALIVIGPEKLPQVARTVGHWVGRGRKYIEGVKNEVEKEFDTTELKRILHNQEVQLRELRDRLNNPQEFLNKDQAETVVNKIEPPLENPYEIIEEKDYQAEQIILNKHDESSADTESHAPVAEPRPDKPV